MSNIVKQEDKNVIEFEINDEAIKLSPAIVNSYIAKGKPLSAQECFLFIQLCKFRKLNPFVGEAYPVKFGTEPAQLIVGKSAFMRKAHENPKYKGHKAGIIVTRDKEVLELEGSFKLPTDVLVGGWAEIYKTDSEIPIKETVSLAEYNKGQSTWKQIPCTMIRKVALCHALREAFPDEMGGMYGEEEMGQTRINIPKEDVEKSDLEKELENEVIIEVSADE